MVSSETMVVSSIKAQRLTFDSQESALIITQLQPFLPCAFIMVSRWAWSNLQMRGRDRLMRFAVEADQITWWVSYPTMAGHLIA
ncbi:MAG: hypothetical protein ACYC0X_08510 [Pirellulaceae bacterium]